MHAVQKASVKIPALLLATELIRSIKDPEHPQSLEDLKVVYEGCVHASLYPDAFPENIPDSDKRYCVLVEFTPTVPHCSLATLIGLCIRVKLEQNYPGEKFIEINSSFPTK